MLKKVYRTIGPTLLISLLAICFHSCENCVDGFGETIIEDRKIDPFKKLDVNIPAEVRISQSKKQTISLEAQENLLDLINSKVYGETLVIESDPCVRSGKPILITLSTPTLSSVKINGSGSVRIAGSFKTDDFAIGINGSGDFLGELLAKSIQSNINGSGDISISGVTDLVEVEINGSGEFRGLGLESNKADITIRGSGDVEVHSVKKLDATILGSGDVRYIGNPDVSSSINGSGEVSKKN